MFKFVVSIIVWFFTALFWWKIYEKAGIKGWKALIPCYEEYIRFKMVGHNKLYVPYLALSVVSGVVSLVYTSILALEGVTSLVDALIGTEFEMNSDLTMLFWSNLILLVGVYLIKLLINIKISLSFGKKHLFGVGLAILPVLFAPILAFGKAEYLGNGQKLLQI